MRLIYNIAIQIYSILIRIAALNSVKAEKFISGRMDWQNHLKNFNANGKKVVWVHASSLGEFDQALPVMEKMNSQRSDLSFVLSFFSPSGYEHAKIPDFIDLKIYLPLDSPKNAKSFIELLNPDLVLFVKYDIWYNYLKVLKDKNIPCILFSALFREEQIYFKWYGRLLKKAVSFFDSVFVQNESSLKLAKKLNRNSSLLGDTRFDRVYARTQNVEVDPLIKDFISNDEVFVVGSSWKDDIEVIAPILNQARDIKIIIAPHNIGKTEVEYLKESLENDAISFSELKEKGSTEAQILIIDNIGMLAMLYSIADFAYVGGAFHKALHNTLEAAVFGVPVIIGPEFGKFPEAFDMIEAGCMSSISNSEEFEKKFRELLDKETRTKQGEIAREFVKMNLGASDKVSQYALGLMN